MEDQLSYPSLRLTVAPEAVLLFTTVLQSGIEIKTGQGQTLANFLNKFPGFTAEYLANTVQTIFLNGTAVDDLSQFFTGHRPVLALSAAMPGLAGAIFRKNSFHSALRTEPKSLQSTAKGQNSLFVTLKLFNSIARDRGQELLEAGVCLRADLFKSFLTKRPNLMQSIVKICLAEKEINIGELLRILPEFSRFNLKIVSKND